MPENVVTSEDVLQKKPKQSKVKKIENQSLPDVAKMVVYYESGFGYIMPNGFAFSKENRMLELPIDEARMLLALDNFRLPNDEEKEMYYNSLEV